MTIVPEAPQANPVVVSGKDIPDSLVVNPDVSVDHFSALAILRIAKASTLSSFDMMNVFEDVSQETPQLTPTELGPK